MSSFIQTTLHTNEELVSVRGRFALSGLMPSCVEPLTTAGSLCNLTNWPELLELRDNRSSETTSQLCLFPAPTRVGGGCRPGWCRPLFWMLSAGASIDQMVCFLCLDSRGPCHEPPLWRCASLSHSFLPFFYLFWFLITISLLLGGDIHSLCLPPPSILYNGSCTINLEF